MGIPAAKVKQLRDQSGAGMMDCKSALVEAGGDLEKAFEVLRKRDQVKAAKKAGRVASDGLVHAYIHPGGRVGVLVEVNCETDFAAKSEPFKTLVKDISMHIAAAEPRFLSRDEVTEKVLSAEREIYREQARASGKPEQAIDKIIEGKLSKFYAESCLTEQPFVKDTSITIKELVERSVATIGENVQIRRFVRYKLGEGIAKSDEPSADAGAEAVAAT
jgi:elongation factor Ts